MIVCAIGMRGSNSGEEREEQGNDEQSVQKVANV